MDLKTFFKTINKQQEKILQKRNLVALCTEVVLLLLSAFVLAMAFPSFCSKDGWNFLVFIALIPLFAVIRNTNFKTVGFYGFLYGFVYYWIFNYWLSSFHPLANLIVQIIKATEMIGLFFCLKIADRFLSKKWSYVVQAIVWVSYSYLCQSWFAGYPYGTVAYAISRYKILIQISDLTGIWLLNFLIVLPQAYLGQWFCDRLSKTSGSNSDGIISDIFENKFGLGLWAALFIFQIVYGFITYSFWHNAKYDTTFKVATVQHNADSWKGGYETYKRNFSNLKKMSLEAREKRPDMIVWSETAFVPSVSWYTAYPYVGNDEGDNFDYLRPVQVLVNDFVNFGNNLGIPLLTGNPSSVIKDPNLPPYDEEGYWNKKDYNSVILFDDGKIKDMYLKQHLVPFTEHFPYEKQLPLLYKILASKGYNWWEKGSESKVFHTSNGITFSTPICFEDVFGYLCADFVKSGADLIVNLTNDSWSGSVAAERQHSAMAVFRAVENRRSVLRGTNSGISCLILPDGTVSGEMEPFKMGWKIWDVPIYQASSYKHTLYTNISDNVAKFFVWSANILLIFGISRNITLKVMTKNKAKKKGY